MPSKIRCTKLLTLWLLPRDLDALDRTVQSLDSDRSKFVRAAIREKLARTNVKFATAKGGV